MSDTQILNRILKMLDTNTATDWSDNDPAEEFNMMAQFIRTERINPKTGLEGNIVVVNGVEMKDCIGLHHDD